MSCTEIMLLLLHATQFFLNKYHPSSFGGVLEVETFDNGNILN